MAASQRLSYCTYCLNILTAKIMLALNKAHCSPLCILIWQYNCVLHLKTKVYTDNSTHEVQVQLL